jgi:transcriptional regulator GlxA family with amidase domain
LLFDEVELLDVAAPLEILSSAGRNWNFRPFKIVTVAEQPGECQTRGQLSVCAGVGFDDCPALEILIVPGGYGARRALARPALVDFVRRAGDDCEALVSIGNGALLLAKAGLLAGVEVAVPEEALETLAELAPSARGNPEAGVRVSGKVVSATPGGRAFELGLHLVERALGKKQASNVARSLGLEWLAEEPPLLSPPEH